MSVMEFWGIEVKPGESVKCEPGDDHYLHLSQASLGEVKKDKGNGNIVINLKFNNQKLIIGMLSANKCPQIIYDLVFEKEFELSHNWKHGSVFFVGYRAFAGDEDSVLTTVDGLTDNNDSESEDEDNFYKEENGKAKTKGELAKPNVNALKADLAAKSSVKTGKPKKAEGEDDKDGDSDDIEDESDDKEMAQGEDDSDDEDSDEDESSEEEDEETPNKVDGKKRPLGSSSKTPAEKKAKLVTPVPSQKTGGGADGKKGGHAATPHSAKRAWKRPVTNDKSVQRTPKPAGSLLCKSCNKTFRQETALQAHTKARHPGHRAK